MDTAKIIYTGVEKLTFTGKNYVFSGFDKEQGASLAAKVLRRGGDVFRTLLFDTDYLVIKSGTERPTPEYLRAAELNEQGKAIGILSEKDFHRLYAAAPVELPTGPGKLMFQNTKWAYIGLSESTKQRREDKIRELGGIAEPFSLETQYALYAPGRSEGTRLFQQAKQRETEKTLVLLPTTVFDVWTSKYPAEDADWSVRRESETAEHYLMHPDLWSEEGSWAPMEEAVIKYYPRLLADLFKQCKYAVMLRVFDRLQAAEKEWLQTGYSDGFYIYSLFSRYTEKVIGRGVTEDVALWLEEKRGRFNPGVAEAAENKLLEYSFGLVPQPLIYWEPGNMHTFGRCPQSESGEDETPIEWLVLEKEGDEALLISRYALDFRQFDEHRYSNSWSSCSLRRWLNMKFYIKAFTPEERKRIETVLVNASSCREFEGMPGPDTRDKVFLLASEEIRKYFATAEDSQCAPTAYAEAKGAELKEGGCCWWLRTIGSKHNSATIVYEDGSQDGDDNYAVGDFYAVRPVIRIKIEPESGIE